MGEGQAGVQGLGQVIVRLCVWAYLSVCLRMVTCTSLAYKSMETKGPSQHLSPRGKPTRSRMGGGGGGGGGGGQEGNKRGCYVCVSADFDIVLHLPPRHVNRRSVSSQCREIDISNMGFDGAWLDRLKGSFPQLTNVGITLPTDVPWWSRVQVLAALPELHALRRVYAGFSHNDAPTGMIQRAELQMLARLTGLRELCLEPLPKEWVPEDMAALVNGLTALDTLSLSTHYEPYSSSLTQSRLALCQELARASSLTSLTLVDEYLPTEGLRAIGLGLSNLKSLELSKCNVGNRDAGHLLDMCLAPFSNLTQLNLYASTLAGEGEPLDLSRLTALTDLNLWQVREDVADGIRALSRLESLNLQASVYLEDQDLVVLRGFPRLKKLDLSYAYRITSEGLRALDCLPLLTDLDLTYAPMLVEQDLALLQPLSSSLQRLRLQDVPKMVQDVGLLYLPLMPALTHLDISYWPELSDTGLLPGLQSLPALQKLYLQRCATLTGSSFEMLPLGLRVLDLYGCILLSEENLKQHLPRLVNLERLCLCDCNPVTPQGLASFPQGLTTLCLPLYEPTEPGGAEMLPVLAHLTRLARLNVQRRRCRAPYEALAATVKERVVDRFVNVGSMCECENDWDD